MFTVDATNLHIVFISNTLKSFPIFRELWQTDVHGGSHCCAQIGGARSDVAQMTIMLECDLCLDQTTCSRKPIKNSMQICALLHRNYSQLVFLVDPDKESFVIVMENSSSIRPISIQTTSF